jgi:predicted transcriptional regulator
MKTQKPAKRDVYREWFDKEVSLGLEDLEAGRVLTDDQVRERILKRRLNRVRTRSKAA